MLASSVDAILVMKTVCVGAMVELVRVVVVLSLLLLVPLV
jgi:hypothetical protein